MHPARWLDVAFGSESRVRILRQLVLGPARAWTERELAQAIGMSPNAVNQAVRSLRRGGIVEVEKVGAAHAVRLAQSASLRASLKAVFESEARVMDDVVRAVDDALPSDAVAYLYGSSVEGSAHAESDVDVLVVAADRERASEIGYEVTTRVLERAPVRLHLLALGAAEARGRLRLKGGPVRAAVERGRRIGSATLEEVLGA